MEITSKSINECSFEDTLWFVKTTGEYSTSRLGAVKIISEPVLIKHTVPNERVIFCEQRHENPLFHLMECLWMMAGRDDSKWLEQFNPRMREFADPNGKIHGAYGWRWRGHWGIDQLMLVTRLLRKDPWSRRAVIQMWDPFEDLNTEHNDFPCNTTIYFRTHGKRLDMTVCNRSNDLVWGMLGSNVVHFSFLHELIAQEVGAELGAMYQFTNNLHVYERHWHLVDNPPHCEKYGKLNVRPYPILRGKLETWLEECALFVRGYHEKFEEPFFEEVALPAFTRDFDKVQASDWRLALQRWSERK